MNSKFVKGLLLILGVFVTAMNAPPVIWPAVIITAICVGAAYYVSNYYKPSVSPEGYLNWKDLLKSVILAVVAAVSNSIPQIIINGVLDWREFWKIIFGVIVTYLGATFFSGNKR